jgi:serine/threonine protein kinase
MWCSGCGAASKFCQDCGVEYSGRTVAVFCAPDREGDGEPRRSSAEPAAPGDAAKSDAAKGDAAKSDAAKSDAAKSDAAESDAAESDAAKSDAAESDAVGWTVTCAACGRARRHAFCARCGAERGKFDFQGRALNVGACAGHPRRSDAIGVRRAGVMHKMGKRLSGWKPRWYVLRDNLLYCYMKQGDRSPRGVIFLESCSVSEVGGAEGARHARNGYFGIDIAPHAGGERRRLFLRSSGKRAKWAAALRTASRVVRLEDLYEVGEKIGSGRFSEVFRATRLARDPGARDPGARDPGARDPGARSDPGSTEHKAAPATDKATESGTVCVKQFAVKVIDKSALGSAPAERDMLRTEIAIMRLVNHPHIVRMEDVFETPEKIHIVMDLVDGGELFDRVVGRACLDEAELHAVCRPLLDSVAYLHQMGIVHRDLKPENILCGASLGDIRIADFGLSRLVATREPMKMACGTLSYVAPEVLGSRGYGKKADLWSVGVIVHLLARGRLPFDGTTPDEIVHAVRFGRLELEADERWARRSPALRAFVRGLLRKDPSERLTAEAALDSAWMRAMATQAVGEKKGDACDA